MRLAADESFDVLAWDLPGHGHNRAVPDEPYSMADLAHGVLRVVDDVLLGRDGPDDAFFYAGGSVGGCVGLQLQLDAPEAGARPRPCWARARASAAAESWAERIAGRRRLGHPRAW